LRITNFEMETAALYGLGKILGLNCCSISTVIDNRATNTASRTMEADVERMIKTALATIEQMP
ncbi:MAG TPA: phosphorylase, partial [Flavipsychrobacter sp.]